MSLHTFLLALLLSLAVGLAASFGGAVLRDHVFDPPTGAIAQAQPA